MSARLRSDPNPAGAAHIIWLRSLRRRWDRPARLKPYDRTRLERSPTTSGAAIPIRSLLELERRSPALVIMSPTEDTRAPRRVERSVPPAAPSGDVGVATAASLGSRRTLPSLAGLVIRSKNGRSA
jgi:hypothetical protein